jgi:RND family efflux transporter MFP subunit
VVTLKVREGARVTRGQLLAEVEPDVNQAKSLSAVQGTVAKARMSFDHAQQSFLRQESLFRAGLLAEQDYQSARVERDLAEQTLASAQADYQIVEARGIPISGGASTQLARVLSPMDGTVIKKGAALGDTITAGVGSFNAGTALFTVADLGALVIKVNLNEVDIPKVRPGQLVTVTLDAYPQKSFPARVSFVAPAAELVDKIKVFKVEVVPTGPTEGMRTGMSVNVDILGESRPRTLSVPLEALQRRDGATVVYRLRPGLSPRALAAARDGLTGRAKSTWLSEHWQDYFDGVPVQAGLATLERVELLGGVAMDDQVCLEDPTRKRVEPDDSDY